MLTFSFSTLIRISFIKINNLQNNKTSPPLLKKNLRNEILHCIQNDIFETGLFLIIPLIPYKHFNFIPESPVLFSNFTN